MVLLNDIQRHTLKQNKTKQVEGGGGGKEEGGKREWKDSDSVRIKCS